MHGTASRPRERASRGTSTCVPSFTSSTVFALYTWSPLDIDPPDFILFLRRPQYYNRWANHELSAKLDREFYVKTEKKMEELQLVSDLSWIEVQFARQAVEQLTAARSTLKWTYAMAF